MYAHAEAAAGLFWRTRTNRFTWCYRPASPYAAERPRLVEIRDNLIDRIAEATREGLIGEVEGLETSLAGAEEKLAQMDLAIARAATTGDLGMPGFTQIAARASDT
ncbi:hypothetical protein ACIQAD_35060 [Streptomyces sp. NPDC088551]|uniref:hypothetical protein n=1 Tax=Streptomyces sp. NPDC088551 TaxID=3365863 RepID=UPI00380A7F70